MSGGALPENELFKMAAAARLFLAPLELDQNRFGLEISNGNCVQK